MVYFTTYLTSNTMDLIFINQIHTVLTFQFGQGVNTLLEDLIETVSSYEIEAERARVIYIIRSYTTANYVLVMVLYFDNTTGSGEIGKPLYYVSDYFFSISKLLSLFIILNFNINKSKSFFS